MFTDFDSINVGDYRQIRKEITLNDVERFVALTGDDNPLHVDAAFASKTPFKDIVVHGMLGASFISTIIGTKLPGPGALWMSQDFNFLLPVRLGDELLIKATVLKIIKRDRILILNTDIENQNGQLVLSGTSQVKVLEQKVDLKSKENISPPKIALITGSTGGIGSAIALALAEKNTHLILHYNSGGGRVQDVCAEIRALNPTINIFPVKANLASTSGIEQLIDDIKNEGLEPNIFVNNAAAPINAASLKDLCWSDIIGHLETQSKVLLQVVQSMTPTFEKQRFGRVVSISSAVSERAVTENWLGYTVNKAVVEKISRQIAIEMGYLGVTSNCIAPGMCETAYIGDISEKIQKIAARQSPNRRLALPEDVSNLAAFLTSDQASHINGQVLHVNGGANV